MTSAIIALRVIKVIAFWAETTCISQSPQGPAGMMWGSGLPPLWAHVKRTWRQGNEENSLCRTRKCPPYHHGRRRLCEIDADAVHLPGIYVQRVLPLTPEQTADKHIERRTVQPRTDAATDGSKTVNGGSK